MSENYIMINGKRIELTNEQLKALGIETRKNPFERVSRYDDYHCINSSNLIETVVYTDDCVDKNRYEACNYFNDTQFAKQVALHQLLYRKLLKFAYDNECEDTAEWNKTNCHYYISYNIDEQRFYADVTGSFKHNDVWFRSRYSAKRAIEEVVGPFMKEHPEFVW